MERIQSKEMITPIYVLCRVLPLEVCKHIITPFCVDNVETAEDDTWFKKYRNGKLERHWYKHVQRFSGGELRRIQYVDIHSHQKEGDDTQWYANGNIKMCQKYESGRKVGELYRWKKDGTFGCSFAF